MDQRPEIIDKVNRMSARSEAERKQLRFAYNLKKLARRELAILRSDEFVEGLQETLQIGASGYRDKELTLLKNLGQGLTAADPTIRQRSLTLLSPAVESCLEAGSEDSISTLIPDLCGWLEFETELLPGHEVMVKRIEALAQRLLDNDCWREVEPLIAVISRIAQGEMKKNPVLRSLAGQVLATLCKKAVLTRLTNDFLLEGQEQQVIANILLFFGAKAAIYHVGRLMVSQNKEERLALTHLIPSFKDQVVPVLSRCLESKPPWYVVRNIIYIVGEIGRDENYALVAHYLDHRDERVQYEMVCCVLKLGGPSMTERLTDALQAVHDRLKVHVIRLLEEHAKKNEGFFTALCHLAEEQKAFSLRSDRDLVRGLIAAFKNFPCRHTINVLEKLQVKCRAIESTEQLVLLIDEAILFIQPLIRHTIQEEKNRRGMVCYDGDPAQEQQAYIKMQGIEPKLARLTGSADMEGVDRLIRKQVLDGLEEGDFIFAELLRDRLLEINPMAFSLAIELGELIEERKGGDFADHHLETWSDLHKHMSTEEFNTLYSCLREERYQKGEFIVKSGETDNKLFFLSSGYVSLGCMIGCRENFLKRMQPGDILGCQHFFSASVWTVSLKALSTTRVQVLDLEVFDEITGEHPNIAKGLREYCRKFADISDLLKMSGEDRREFPRFSGELRIRTTLVDPYGTKSRRGYKGDLVDISKGGLAFTIRISTKSSARLLLGRQVTTDLILDGEMVTCSGIIVGVRQQDSDEQAYSVHVKLSKHIEEKRFGRIISMLQ